jgi:recombination associated protein RdgC
MFKNLLVYRIAPGWQPPPATALEAGLASHRFTGCRPTDSESAGWAPPRGPEHGPLLEVVAGQLVMLLGTQSRILPASVVREEMAHRLDAAEKALGHAPGRSAKKEIKEQVIHELLPRAFTKTSHTLVWLDPGARWLVVGSGSVKKADAVISALVEAFDSAGRTLSLTTLRTQLAPGTAMSGWLHGQQSPPGFSVDRECELKSAQDEGATVRYSKHALDIDEVVQHIESGKAATKLALTWRDRVSFVLGADLSLKKIELLEGVVDGGGSASDGADDTFDADVAISTGELARLIPDLIEALGGELDEGVAAPTPVARIAQGAQRAPGAVPWDEAA